MRIFLIALAIILGWVSYKEVMGLRKCAIRRNFTHPTMAALFNYAVKMIGTGIITLSVMMLFICAYNWDLTSQLFVRIMVNLFH